MEVPHGGAGGREEAEGTTVQRRHRPLPMGWAASQPGARALRVGSLAGSPTDFNRREDFGGTETGPLSLGGCTWHGRAQGRARCVSQPMGPARSGSRLCAVTWFWVALAL